MATATFKSPKKGAAVWHVKIGTYYFFMYDSKTGEVVVTETKGSNIFERFDASLISHRKPRSQNHFAKYL